MARTSNRGHVASPERPRLRWLLILLLPLLVACGAQQTGGSPPAPTAAEAPSAAAQPTTAMAGKKIKAVTTMSILADMVNNIGGERVEARNIIPLGAGPEDYQPTPQDAQAIAAADIVFYNGHGLEEWIGDLFKSAARTGQPQIAVSEGLQAVDVGSADFKEGNPHFWMSAAYGTKYVKRTSDGLIGVDPDGKDVYTKNADAYIKQLLDLNAELKQQDSTLPQAERKMVTNHDAFPYFAQEYGFTIVGNILGNPQAELSAGDLAQLVQKIKQERVKAVFSESQFNPKMTQTLADEAGVKVVATLYTDTLGEAGSGVTSYVDMLRYDMKTIVDALK